MLTVIFNKDMESEFSYNFDTYTEGYLGNNDGWNLRFETVETNFDNDDNFEELKNNISTTKRIETIYCYDEDNQQIDFFDDYHEIESCFVYYDGQTKQKKVALSFIK